MSESLTKLRETIRLERRSYTASIARVARGDTDAALAAAEQEMAELRRTCPDCGSPMPGEMCAACALVRAEAEIAELRKKIAAGRYVACVMCGERIGGYDPTDPASIRAVRDAAVAHEYRCPNNPVVAEIAELRKRPTLEEVLSRLDPTDLPGDSEEFAPLWDAAIGRIRALYAEKATTP